ncbi:MAG: LamB/YcsF family protein, partial [Campylobacterota bacterium]
MKLNCDMGEALDANLDEQIMPYIDMANLACAF